MRVHSWLALALALPVHAFVVVPSASRACVATRPHHVALKAAAAASVDAPPPIKIPRSVTVKGQLVTPYGLFMSFSAFFVAFAVQIPVVLTFLYSKAFDRQRRAKVDWVIHIWAWATLRIFCGFRCEVVGAENLPAHGENFLCVPNHTSFLDILALTGFVPRPMKYVSKAEILAIPCIGWSMRLAGHIALKTTSRRSQLETFKTTVGALKAGSSVITFPEGTRSADGRLKAFKRGPFKMALQAGVPIVPVSICGLARWYPKGTLLPIGVPQGVKIVIHPPIDVAGSALSEAELAQQAFETVNGALPGYQQALPGQEAVA